MKRDLIIYTQRPDASTPKELKRELDARRLGLQRTRETLPVPAGSLVINWGGSRMPEWARRDTRFINHPDAVRRKTSKVGQIRRFREAGVPTLEITTTVGDAARWLREGSRVLARRDASFGGRGIAVLDNTHQETRLPGADFYSRYFPKTHEYRYHVFQGRVIDVAQKKRRLDIPREQNGNPELHQRVIRSYGNGWIFAHNNLHLPDEANNQMATAAIQAVRALSLDFGAVDVLARFSKREPERLLAFAVCEVNTAPCVECTQTLAGYVAAIQALYEAR